VISGGKWFTTGAEGASLAIIMAKLSDGPATMFLADMTSPGIVIERAMDSLDTCFPGGHAVVPFDGVRVPAADVLGGPGEGFRYAQVRLSPARLTHCMRWLGAARRAHDVASAYARERQAFGKALGEHEGVGFMLADNEMDLHITRLAIWHCAWVLDQGALGKHESSVAKVVSSEALWRTVDRSVQVLGGQGVTHETVVARIFADMRVPYLRWSVGSASMEHCAPHSSWRGVSRSGPGVLRSRAVVAMKFGQHFGRQFLDDFARRPRRGRKVQRNVMRAVIAQIPQQLRKRPMPGAVAE
jgi:alkylation response protein AidB-like acyl-CoA dehydrogenase